MSCWRERCVNYGEPCLELEEFAPVKQEIVCSRSFGERLTEYDDVRQAICSYAARAAEKLRNEHQHCRFISVFVKTSPFALNEPYYGNSASVKLLTPTQIAGILSAHQFVVWMRSGRTAIGTRKPE